MNLQLQTHLLLAIPERIPFPIHRLLRVFVFIDTTWSVLDSGGPDLCYWATFSPN